MAKIEKTSLNSVNHTRTTGFKRKNNSYAVILIDMQTAFVPKLAKPERESEISNQIEVLSFCRNHNIPVFLIELQNSGKTIKRLSHVINGLRKKKLIIKRANNAFYKTQLHSELKKAGIKNILLMGLNASICVRETAKHALMLGYNIITSRDIIADAKDLKERFPDESTDWYKTFGMLKDSHRDLLKIIQSGSKHLYPSSIHAGLGCRVDVYKNHFVLVDYEKGRTLFHASTDNENYEIIKKTAIQTCK